APAHGPSRGGRQLRCSRRWRARGPGPGSRRGTAAGFPSGVHLHETVVELALVVEDRPACVVLGPGDHREVRIWPVPAGEDLVAGAERVEEVDGRATGDPMPGRADVAGDAVVGQDGGGVPAVGPV